MVAQSVTRGVRSLMQTLYKAGVNGETGKEEDERQTGSPPAKRRKISPGDVDTIEGQDETEPTITTVRQHHVVQKRRSLRTRRSRNYTDHDINEEEGAQQDANGGVKEDGLELVKTIPRQISQGTTKRSQVDHDKNADNTAFRGMSDNSEPEDGHSIISPTKMETGARRNGKLKSIKGITRKNNSDEEDLRHNIVQKDATRRLSSRSRNKRNNADHTENEQNNNEFVDGMMFNSLDTRPIVQSKEGSNGKLPSTERLRQKKHVDTNNGGRGEGGSYLLESHPVRKLSARDRRKKNRADHHDNEDSSPGTVLNDGLDLFSTPTKRLYRDVEQYKDEVKEKRPSILQSSPSTASTKTINPHRRGKANSKMVENSPSRAKRNDQNSPFISSKNAFRDVSNNSEDYIDAGSAGILRKVIRDRLTCNRSTKLVGVDSEYQKVYRLIEQTVSAGEGNSVLLIGSRGCGKSAIACKAVEEISREHSHSFYVIKLNGFLLTDDRLALREIWRQLGQEMEVEDDTSGKNYADTLSKLLALLSHTTETEDDDVAAKAQKSVIFIMEEFDQFTAHPRQTLLYNLFDIAQSRKAPIAVIGMTTRIDIAESMEKRVKSRFSHRYIHIPLARHYNTFKAICSANLEHTSENLNPQELMQLSKTQALTIKAKKGQKRAGSNILDMWNNRISNLLDEPVVSHFIRQKYETSKSAPDAINALCAQIFGSANFMSSAKETSDFHLFSHFDPPESKLFFLPYLPTLALALLIAASRLDIVLDTDTVNFSMVYEEYSSLAGKARIASAAGGAVTAGANTKIWSREVAIKQWDRLVNYGFLMPIQGTVAPFGMYRVDVALEEIAPNIPDMDRILEKWCKQI